MMNDDEIAALAKGMVPFVRDCVDEAFSKLMVTDELAEQVASAVRMLHESPPIEQRNEMPQVLPPPKVTCIKRDEDGNFVPIYDETQS
jgi:hypothetical protein